ncbi:MAG: diguanylate cyclase [Spirochaetales bacterium]|nr:diguanylate cyclase [Spirochaetales bacterium]
MSRISLRIIGIIILCVIFTGISIGTLSVMQAGRIMERESYEKFEYISLSYANEFSLLLEGVEKTIQTITAGTAFNFDPAAFASNPDYRTDYMEQAGSLLKHLAENNGAIQGIYLAINPELTGKVYEAWYISDGAGNYIFQEAEDISLFYPENEDMKWYYDPVKAGRGIWSAPYTDATINVKMVSYTEAVFIGDQLVGVAGIDMAFTDILERIRNIDLYETGYGILLDSDLKIISHPELEEGTDIRSLDNGGLSSVADAFQERESDTLDYVYEGNNKILGFSRLSNDWIFIAAAEMDNVRKPVSLLRFNILFIVFAAVLISIAAGLKMSRSIMLQLNKLHDLTVAIGNGNYDVKINNDTKDEFAGLISSFETMSRKIAKTQDHLVEVNKNMEVMAFHDSLTRLPNRRSGMESLEQMLKQYDTSLDYAGIMLIDLDYFKEVNDSMGHDAGDQLLLGITEKMSHQIGNKDILCRQGGDEFLLIFKEVPRVELIRALAERLLAAASEHMTIEKRRISISCSIGIALINGSNLNRKSLLREADQALYAVKRKGRNNYAFFREAEPD